MTQAPSAAKYCQARASGPAAANVLAAASGQSVGVDSIAAYTD